MKLAELQAGLDEARAALAAAITIRDEESARHAATGVAVGLLRREPDIVGPRQREVDRLMRLVELAQIPEHHAAGWECGGGRTLGDDLVSAVAGHQQPSDAGCLNRLARGSAEHRRAAARWMEQAGRPDLAQVLDPERVATLTAEIAAGTLPAALASAIGHARAMVPGALPELRAAVAALPEVAEVRAARSARRAWTDLSPTLRGVSDIMGALGLDFGREEATVSPYRPPAAPPGPTAGLSKKQLRALRSAQK